VSVPLGIDVGGTSTKWVVLEGDGIAESGTFPTPTDPLRLAELLRGSVRRLAEVDRIGLALPAVLDPDRRSVAIAPNLDAAWVGVPVGARLAEELELPAGLCNDARAFALAESRAGAGRGAAVVAAITLGTGVGGAIVVGGRLEAGTAGELGHILVVPGGRRCGCGAEGCLEAYAGGRSLLEWCAAEGASFGDLRELVAGAQAADPVAAAALDRAGRALGQALQALAIARGPEVVVVGGGLSGAFEMLAPAAEAVLAGASPVTPSFEIRPAQLGEHAGAIGAAIWNSEGAR
jgi:glucokinase